MMSDSGCGCGSLKRSRTKEQQKSKRDSDRARAKTRVNLGEAFKGWRELRQRKGMKSDPQLAFFLMNSYTKRAFTEEEELKSSRTHTHSEHRDKAGSALSKASEAEHQTVVGVDETLHEEEKPFKFPSDPVAVQEQEQLREKRACIAYEECLRKLGTFLQLPLQKCPHVDPITKTKCGCCSPFELEISSRGTAFIMEWTCSSGHSLWKWNSQPLLQFGIQSGDFMLSSSILLSGSSYSEVSLLFKHMNMGMMEDTTLHSKQDTNTSMKEKDSLTTTGEGRTSSSEFPADVEQQLQMKEEQQEWSCSLNQEETTLQNIKEEQEEFWETDQDEDQPQGLEEDFNIIAVKNEDDEERLHLLQLNQRQSDESETGADEENCEEPEPDRNSDPENYSAAEIEVKIDDFSETESDDGDVHSCSECGKRFTCRRYLMRHKAVHLGRKPFSCSDCGKKFALKQHLSRHTAVHTGEKPFSCSECGKRFIQKTDLTHHMANHGEEKPFSCCECGQRFNRKFDLMAHMPRHSKLKPFSCSECGRRYSDKRRLARHMRDHAGGKPFSCSECGKQFREQSLLVRHMMIHTGEKPFSCSECGKRFNQKSSLTRHIMRHTGEKPLSCSECGKEFKNKYMLTGHMRTHTGEKPFGCSECGKRFGRKFYLKSHMALHREEKLFSCSECGKSFHQKSGLSAHMEYHREKLFSCSECGKRYTVKRNLARHMLVHSGERPFSCPVCGKTFKQKAHLSSHMPVHTEEKPYSCSECDRRFYRKWHLTSHMFVHTGGKEKLYGSSVCEQTFAWSPQLEEQERVNDETSELHQNQTEEKEGGEAEAGGDGGCEGSNLEKLSQTEAEIKTEFEDSMSISLV